MIDTDMQSEKIQTPEPESTDSTPEIDNLPSHEETITMGLPEDQDDSAETHEDGQVAPRPEQEQAAGGILSKSPGEDEPPDPKNA